MAGPAHSGGRVLTYSRGMRRSLPAVLILAAATGALAFTSCAAGVTTPAASPTTTAGAAASSPGPSASVSGAVGAPAVCDAVELKPGASATGSDLAACVVGFSRAAGSGRETFTASDGSSGQADFVFGDAPAMAGTVTGADGSTSFVLTPDAAWITIDGVWVEGDASSTDPKRMLAGTVGQAYRAFADPSATTAVISASASWTVQTDQDVLTLPDDTEVPAWRLQSDAAFTAVGADVQEMVVWLTSAHVPVGVQATASVGGIQTTTVQHYYGWGTPVAITTPQP